MPIDKNDEVVKALIWHSRRRRCLLRANSICAAVAFLLLGFLAL